MCQFSPASVNEIGNSTVTIVTIAASASLRRRTPPVLVLLLCAVVLGKIGCGGGNGSGGGGAAVALAPTGNYNIVETPTTSDGVVPHSRIRLDNAINTIGGYAASAEHAASHSRIIT
jgi:hypothetical protein